MKLLKGISDLGSTSNGWETFGIFSNLLGSTCKEQAFFEFAELFSSFDSKSGSHWLSSSDPHDESESVSQ